LPAYIGGRHGDNNGAGPIGLATTRGAVPWSRSRRPPSCASQRQDGDDALLGLSPAMPLHYEVVKTI
jgi:hypothetical protein